MIVDADFKSDDAVNHGALAGDFDRL